jgi:ankyrin repeat protein
MLMVPLLSTGIFGLSEDYIFRAAEVGSIECAKILLDSNADIDALNFSGHTALHVVSLLNCLILS